MGSAIGLARPGVVRCPSIGSVGSGSESGRQAVASALVPEFGWDEDGLSDGMTARVLLGGLLLDGIPADPVEQAELRTRLLTYCGTDTLATVRLLAALRALAGLS